MYILKCLLLFIFIFSCNTEPIRNKISVGKTIKIMPSNFGTGNVSTNYNFLWSKPIGPNNSNNDLEFSIQNDKMLFTPMVEGNYDINLTIENLNNTSLYQETFSYYAIINEDSNTLNRPLSNIKDRGLVLESKNGDTVIVSHSSINTISEKKKIWTIQIMANPSIEVARKKQLELNQKGFDAYTEAVFNKKENKEYWRVRIGNFTDKETGQKVVKSLKDLGYETWFTNFYQ